MLDYQICKEGGTLHPRTSCRDAGIAHGKRGDVMERREWKYRDGSGVIYEAESVPTKIIARYVDKEIAEVILAEHNQHAALVKQRNELTAALRFLLKDYEETYRDLTDGQFEFNGTAIRQARNALAAAEQGGES